VSVPLIRESVCPIDTCPLAHELNQPLTAILRNAQPARRYLESGDTNSDEIRDILDAIVRDDKRASDIIHRLRREVQKEETIREPFDLNASIREVIEVLFKDIKKNGIKLDHARTSDVAVAQVRFPANQSDL
jgi:signal transduction histidine kinase